MILQDLPPASLDASWISNHAPRDFVQNITPPVSTMDETPFSSRPRPQEVVEVHTSDAAALLLATARRGGPLLGGGSLLALPCLAWTYATCRLAGPEEGVSCRSRMVVGRGRNQ